MLISILLALAAPTAAQNLRATLITPGAPSVTVTPALTVTAPRLTVAPLALPAASLTPTLPAPAIVAVVAAQAAPAPLASFVQTQAAAQPALQALSVPNPSASGAHAAGVSLEDALTGRKSIGAVFAAPVGPVNGIGRSEPAVSGVSYAKDISARQRARLDESLRRRKAGWYRGLSRMGITLAGPESPKLKVVKAETLSSKGLAAVVVAEAFTVEWSQGRTRGGSFRVTVPAKDPEPEFRRLADPAVPDAAQVVVRFKTGAADADIRAFLESQGLRVISRGYDGTWLAGVTGRAKPAAAAKRLLSDPLVLSAAAKLAAFAEADQALIAFRAGADETALADALKRHKLTVLERTRDGLWRVGTPQGRADKVRAALETEAAVLYARTLKADFPESRQAIVTLRTKDEDALRAFLRHHGLTVLDVLGERTFRVAGTISEDAGVESVVAVGSLPDAAVDAAAAGAASYKGRPWSATEYNLNWALGYGSLARLGASAAQLARYERLTAEAPVRGGGFNPWSGD
ncbi:MAG: hypothetical protein HYZ75_19815 [Elusimicrobia bacterium]|nr:hypothetical protein [Elusimicrobiota bacterium]